MTSSLAPRLAAVAAIILLAGHFYGFYRTVHDAKQSLDTRQHLRRLAALTIRNFPARDLESPDLFWQSIGREGKPMQDVWGGEYRLTVQEEKSKRRYFWASAGPDRVFGNRDDIVVEVPYPDGPGTLPDLGPHDDVVQPPQSYDAK